jgi:hypothetical protein
MIRVTIYTLVVAAVSSVGLVTLMTHIPDLPPASPSGSPPIGMGVILPLTSAAMCLAGIVGGALSNFRGLIKHSSEGDYGPQWNLSYYLRPPSGGLCGLVVFFLLLGGAMILTIGTTATTAAWSTQVGRMPYFAMALLSGYASTEFMAKLKELAQSLFAQQNKSGGAKGGTHGASVQPPGKTDVASGERTRDRG